MQDYKRSADKQRLFNDFNAGRVRILIGSSDTMGTGVNVQQRLKALHHLDVPWLPIADRAARGTHRAAGQPARRDRDLCLRHARLDGRHDVAEQRAQGAVHRRGALRRPQHPPPRRCRQPGQPVRDGQGDRVGRQPADAEGRTGRARSPGCNASAPRTLTISSTSAGRSPTRAATLRRRRTASPASPRISRAARPRGATRSR